MHGDKYYLAFDDDEKSLLIKSLNKLRTKQINQSKDTAPVNEVLQKILKAKKKKFKIINTEV